MRSKTHVSFMYINLDFLICSRFGSDYLFYAIEAVDRFRYIDVSR